MKKMNLPVILLKGIVLLPNNDLRLEFENNESKNILSVSEFFHDNKLLVVSQINLLEESTKVQDLPKIGVISKINHKMELPNGNVRVTISGLSRAYVHEYLDIDRKIDNLESIASEVLEINPDITEEPILLKKIYKEFENHIKIVPYITNSILSTLANMQNLSKMTDIIAMQVATTNERLNEYLNTFDIKMRSEMVLQDIYEQQEIFKIEKNIEQKVKKNIDSTQKEYFLREKIKVIKEELGDSSTIDDTSDLKQKINNLNAPDKIKKRLYEEIKRLESSTNISPEINVIRNYIDTLLSLPWNNETKDNDDLTDVKHILDNSHYGLEKVKERILEYLAVKQMKNSLNGPILCLVGPPGVGKTSLAFSIAKAMNRQFTKISVGGVHDESEIKGHRRSYVGAGPGRIIEGLKKAGTRNPVFLIDEIDKMTKSTYGDPASSLLEVLDPEQNMYFSDHFVEEEVDLSNVMFITTANYLDNIPEALKDRLEIINLSGYTEFEKVDIAKKHLLKKICIEHGIKSDKVEMADNVILHIIRYYTKEAGVRELERCLACIVRKIVTDIVVNKKTENKYNIKLEHLEKYLGKEKFHNMDLQKIRSWYC